MFASKDIFQTASTGGYKISRSVRLRSSASAYFSRTPASAGNRRTWTFSAWVKKTQFTGTAIQLFSAYSDINNGVILFSTSAEGWGFQILSGGASAGILSTSASYRDPAAWYHVVISCDTTQATSSERMKLFVNGVQVTAFISATYPTQNFDTQLNNTVAHAIAARAVTPASYFDCYLTEANLIDGQALTPSSFGETNPVTGVWQPKKYAGTYGTNGFYLNFSDNSTAAALGTDFSGNSNTWTVNNISVTAGVTYDSMLDVPTPYADGGNGRGNYPTWNPLTAGGLVTFSQANLNSVSTSASAPFNIESTIKTPTTGKWYAEITMTKGASSPAVGIGNNPSSSNSNTDQFTAYRVNATYITSGMGASSTGTPATFTTNDVIGIAYDAGAGTLVFYKNGTLQTGGFTGITAGNYSFIVRKDSATGDGGYLNCGQRPFSYTPPTGFVALNTQNLPAPTISNGANYMAATTYTGTGSALTIANTVGSASFQPDLVWVKGRSGATDHALYDAVRGVQLQLESNTTTDETTETTGLTAFGSTGFTVGALAQMNTSAATYVAWQWKEGATQGFDIVTYTGSGSARTISHNLGVVPNMIIVKARTTASTDQGWPVYHSANTAAPETDYLLLNSTAATADLDTVWNDTAPTSSVFSVGTNANVNANNDTYVAYCFAAVAGYSAFGSYVGNGSTDGPFVFLGFRPRWVMIKRTNDVADWVVVDSARNTYNVAANQLAPNLSAAETTTAGLYLDLLSNGFKLRGTGGGTNVSGSTYIYACFAENPFKLALAE